MIETLIEAQEEYNVSMRLLEHLARQQASVRLTGPRRSIQLHASARTPNKFESSVLGFAPDDRRARLEGICADIASALRQHTSQYREVQAKVNNMVNEFVFGRYQEFMRARALDMGAAGEELIQRGLDEAPIASFVSEWGDTMQAGQVMVEVFQVKLSLAVDVAMGYAQSPPCWPETQPIEW